MSPRKNLTRSLLLVLIVAGIAVPTAYADSDGYFCSGPGYLAVEFRAFSTRGLSGEHVLKILRFDDALGPRWIGEVVVEEFQTHTLNCAPDAITFEGVGERGRGLVTYLVKLDEKGVPRIVSQSSNPQYVFVAKEGPPNLGNWARQGITPLQSAVGAHRFQLRFTEAPARREGRTIFHDKRTVIEEVEEGGRVVRSLILHEGTSIETFD
jgi:hypothetical protein